MLPIDHSLMVPRTNAGIFPPEKHFAERPKNLANSRVSGVAGRPGPRAKWFGLVALGQFKGQWWLVDDPFIRAG